MLGFVPSLNCWISSLIKQATCLSCNFERLFDWVPSQYFIIDVPILSFFLTISKQIQLLSYSALMSRTF
jgi:hypothetical protein